MKNAFLFIWWRSNEWKKQVVGSNKMNVQKFRRCDSVDWTVIDVDAY